MRKLFYLGINHSILFLCLIPGIGISTPFTLTLHPAKAYNYNLQNTDADFFLAGLLVFLPNEITRMSVDKPKELNRHFNKEFKRQKIKYKGFFSHLIFLKNSLDTPTEITLQLEYSGHYPLSLINITGNNSITSECHFVLRIHNDNEITYYLPEELATDRTQVNLYNIDKDIDQTELFTISSANFNKILCSDIPKIKRKNSSFGMLDFKEEPISILNCINDPRDDIESEEIIKKIKKNNIKKTNLEREKIKTHIIVLKRK